MSQADAAFQSLVDDFVDDLTRLIQQAVMQRVQELMRQGAISAQGQRPLAPAPHRGQRQRTPKKRAPRAGTSAPSATASQASETAEDAPTRIPSALRAAAALPKGEAPAPRKRAARKGRVTPLSADVSLTQPQSDNAATDSHPFVVRRDGQRVKRLR